MALDLVGLEAEVARNKTVDDSAAALIAGMAQKIEDSKNDPVALQALVDELRSSSDALSAAVSANTVE